MGLFGNTSQQPTKKKKLLNISEDQLNSIQQAIPVKYLAGREYVAGDFISPAYNPKAVPLQSQTGKNETSTTGYKYFADFALVFCMGGRRPVDAVYTVIMDSDIIWTGNITRGSGDYGVINVTQGNRGSIYLYWGSETQAIDSVLLTPRSQPLGPLGSPTDNTTWDPTGGSILAGDPNPFVGHYDHHPAYRGQCYAVFKNWKLGRDRVQVPNIQLELKRGCPWVSGGTLDAEDRGINPIAVLYDWLTDTRFGMGLPDANLNIQSFINTFNYLESIQPLPARISPLITAQSEFRQIVAQLLEYYDGWIRRNGTQLEVGLWSKGAVVISGTTPLTDDNLLAEPSLSPQGWGPTFNEITVQYRARDHHFNDYTQTYRDPNNFRITGYPRPETLKRDWFTDKDITKQYARQVGAVLALPYTEGDLKVRREWLDNNAIMVGDVINYNSGFYGLSFNLRVEEIEFASDSKADATLTVQWDRSRWPALYVPPGFQGPGGFFSGPRAIYKSKIIEVPYQMLDLAFATQVVVLAVRGNVDTHGMRVWFSLDGGSTYQQAPTSQSTGSFASYGTLNAAMAAGDTTFVVNLFGIDLDLVVSQTPSQASDDTLLMFIDFEVITIQNVTALGGGQYQFDTAQRGRFGTTAQAHSANVDVYFQFRHSMLLIDNTAFLPGVTVLFKVQPFTFDVDYDLTAITPISYTILGFGNIASPVLIPSSGTFVTSLSVNCGNPQAGFLTLYTTDGQSVNAASRQWPQSGGLNQAITITTSTTFKVRYYSPDGRASNETTATYSQLPAGTTAPAGQCGAPTWSFSGSLGSTSGNITLTNTQSGATILYSLNGGATTTYTGPVALACTSTGDKIEFWATLAGLADSAHKFVNNTKSTPPGGGFSGGGGSGVGIVRVQ